MMSINSKLFTTTIITTLLVVFLSVFTTVVVGENYDCTVDSTLPISQGCIAPNGTTTTDIYGDSSSMLDGSGDVGYGSSYISCLHISDCLNYSKNLTLKSTDVFSINLPNPVYNGEESCNLNFQMPCNLIISPPTKQYSTIDCTNQSSFISHLKANVVIMNLNIQNAYDSCINIPTNNYNIQVLIYNSTFQNCQSTTNGGAIQMYYPNTLNVVNTTFISNNAQHYGGAISAYNVHTSNSTFRLNTAGHWGGAIYSDFELGIESCDFISNSAINYGGAIYAVDLYTIFSTFDSNFAFWGGAVFTQSILVLNSVFTSNLASYGGAVVLAAPFKENLIKSSVIISNSANEDGGALYILSPQASNPPSSLTLTHTKITENSAEGSGGAVFFNNTLTTYLLGGDFYDNTTPQNETNEFGCDQDSQGYNCNLCTTPTCTQCLDIANSICVEGYGSEVLCLVSRYSCVYGQCRVNLTYSCSCDFGFHGTDCSTPDHQPTHPPTPTPSGDKDSHTHSLTLALEISIPVGVGLLIIIIIVKVIISKKKTTRSGYKRVLNHNNDDDDEQDQQHNNNNNDNNNNNEEQDYNTINN